MTDSDLQALKDWFDGKAPFPDGDQFFRVRLWFSRPDDPSRTPFVCPGDDWSEVLLFLYNVH